MTTTLEDAVACYGGIKRPHIAEENGGSVFVYVLNPKVSLVYEADKRCVAKPFPVPSGAVLTAQVCLTEPLQESGVVIQGSVTRLEFVPSDDGDPMLPVDFQERYERPLWRKT